MAIVYVVIGIIWLVIDQVTKLWVQEGMTLGQSIPLIPNVFHLTYILNKGAAFGILANQRLFFLCIVMVLLAVLWYFRQYIRTGDVFTKLGTTLLVSGALGNAWDRYHIGAVVDFFDFRIWPIFNVADVGICVGVALLAIHVWRSSQGGKHNG
ncbi:signal peptidase II [Veillonella sp.]|uniref:signal peptidase II n=1 Tax=Veillonella sp. TaxID=1926307 RepID=UPI0025CD1346|nr:signal peptidase II [Veillonella sp.]